MRSIIASGCVSLLCLLVQALSDSGQGSWSLLGTGKTLPGPPAAVTGLSLVSQTFEMMPGKFFTTSTQSIKTTEFKFTQANFVEATSLFCQPLLISFVYVVH